MQEQTDKKPFDLYAESKEFAIRSIKLYQYLTEPKDAQASMTKNAQASNTQYASASKTKEDRREYILSKQFLLAGTRIGDLIRQENDIEAYHSARSAKYWLELLQSGGYLTAEEAESMISQCLPLVKILYVRSHPNARKDGKEQKGGTL